MVKVTSKDYYLDGFAKQICDKIVERVSKRKQDILVILGGQEGSGKTNASVALCYYIGDQTERKFDVDNVFFDLDEMIKFAGSTSEQIILWDEAALGGLAADWTNHAQRKLKAMLMVCRKKRHVFMFNVPRFYRLSGDIIERAYCMFQIYENDKEQPGNFMFFGRDSLEALYTNWKSKKYAQYAVFKKLFGCFTWVLPKLIDEDKYEANKDAAILKLANSETTNPEKKDKLLEERKKIISSCMRKGFLNKEIAAMYDIDPTTLSKWKNELEMNANYLKLKDKNKLIEEKEDKEEDGN